MFSALRAPNVILAEIELLLDQGADVNARDYQDSTPLHRANTPEIAGLLLDRGADINARGNLGQSLIHRWAGATGHPHRLATLELFLNRGADTDIRSNVGRPPLYLLASQRDGDPQAAALMLDLDADINSKDDDGKTPLYSAGEKSTRRWLTSCWTGVRTSTSGMNPQGGRSSIWRYLQVSIRL